VTAWLLPAARLVRQAVPHVIEAIVGPSAAFLAGHAMWGLSGALILAFVWTGGCLALRTARHRGASGLLMIACVSLVLRTVVSVVAHSSKAFFLGPDVVTAGLGLVFLASAFTSRPLATRVLGELVPAHILDVSHPRAARLCRIASALWGAEQLITATVSVWLVYHFSPTEFVTLHEPISIGVFLRVMGAALPFFWSDVRGVREGHVRAPALALPAALV
jgi:hypothetical protein